MTKAEFAISATIVVSFWIGLFFGVLIVKGDKSKCHHD